MILGQIVFTTVQIPRVIVESTAAVVPFVDAAVGGK